MEPSNANETIIPTMVILCQFKDAKVTAIIDECGEPWFVAKEVCGILEIENFLDAVTSLDDDEKNTVVISDGIRGNTTSVIVNEFGLYCLIIRSDKPQAKAFRKWITSEVLPAIYRTGNHDPDETQQIERFLKDPARLMELLSNYTETTLKLTQETMAPSSRRRPWTS